MGGTSEGRSETRNALFRLLFKVATLDPSPSRPLGFPLAYFTLYLAIAGSLDLDQFFNQFWPFWYHSFPPIETE